MEILHETVHEPGALVSLYAHNLHFMWL